MSATKHICPFERCLDTFDRTVDVKVHMNLHLVCHWYRCPFCPKGYLQQINAIAHVATCPSRVAGKPDTLREHFDARYPLLRMWSHKMGVPKFKNDGTRDAEMVVRDQQVWECAEGSREPRVQAPNSDSKAPVS